LFLNRGWSVENAEPSGVAWFWFFD
jgi:hypothetical protein